MNLLSRVRDALRALAEPVLDPAISLLTALSLIMALSAVGTPPNHPNHPPEHQA